MIKYYKRASFICVNFGQAEADDFINASEFPCMVFQQNRYITFALLVHVALLPLCNVDKNS